MLNVQPYLDQFNKRYIKIITINKRPDNPLNKHIIQIRPPKLSPFKEFNTECGSGCIYGFKSLCNSRRLMTADEVPNLFSLLIESGYKIDTDITKMMNKSNVQMSNDLLCFIQKV